MNRKKVAKKRKSQKSQPFVVFVGDTFFYLNENSSSPRPRWNSNNFIRSSRQAEPVCNEQEKIRLSERDE